MSKALAIKNAVRQFCAETGMEVGSHMFKGMFVASLKNPGGMLEAKGRDWHVAKVTQERNSKGQFVTVVRIITPAAELHNDAKVELGHRLAEQGISPRKARPDVTLDGLPVFPVTALAGF